ncbi:hypothetical protein HMPREF9303_0824 [Prevotella denticola CRIS 18C-A]|uniref:PIN domain-containing protein n=2 Tax=Prevotella denticola TaxID=28129 RepID=F0HAW7_9BACT|nr:hypothetical protein HMPREF9303_0824 [Prevotella denticola CRIS 18C-A]
MKYTRKDYESFLSTELETQMREYVRLVETKAIVLKERGDVFVGRFIKLQENGMVIFKVRVNDNMPRKNTFWTASYFINEMGSYKNWGELSWAELRKQYQRECSEALCAWLSKSDDSNFCLVGIKNISVEFAQMLGKEKPIIAFGPSDPPLEYLMNLIAIVRDTNCTVTKQILDFEQSENNIWDPTKVESKENLNALLAQKLQVNNCVEIQGPPGTGKTFRMAELSAELLRQRKSVLVTALTNQALIELVKKKDLKDFLEVQRISKTSLTVDERKEVPKLQPNAKNLCNAAPGYLSLATFYLSSAWAKDATDIPFDYVIMDEASQALYPMIAASMKLGRKVIWIGDQNQLPPIVITGEDVINRYDWGAIVKGFNTLCVNFSYPSFMLKDTFRLTGRGAACTGIFYNNDLNSVSEVQVVSSAIKCMNKNGGPTFWGMDLEPGNKIPDVAIHSIIDLVVKILAEDPETKVAVLSKFRATVRQLQKQFILQSKKNEIPENLKIETVDRVQGLTVNYCIFFIPNASLKYSLEKELFNVATSRAQYCTVIVADKSLLGKDMEDVVRKYLLKSQDDKFVEFNNVKTISSGNISVNVLDKIDLSKFEKKRKEIVEGKENIYIIDTNVFVHCPNIIGKIGHKYKIVVPAKVLEELDKLKLKESIDKKALSDAARNINIAFTKHFSKMEDADVSLLPVGFDKKNPDCQILSVALKYKGENPIVLTSDNILQTRANGLGITTISLSDFLKQLR